MSVDEVDIVDVWADNLEEAFEQIRQIVDDYPYIAMVLPPWPLPFYDHIISCLFYRIQNSQVS